MIHVCQDMCGSMHPSVACLDIRPQWLCRRNFICSQSIQFVEWGRQSSAFRGVFQGGHNQGESLMQFEAGSRKGRMSIVGQSTSDCKTLFPCDHRFLIILLLSFPLNWTNATYLLCAMLSSRGDLPHRVVSLLRGGNESDTTDEQSLETQ